MKTLQFKVELLSDIILNQKAASKGNQQTLDFIPGSNFLGIVATSYKDFNKKDQLTIFHSSKVRFGDAHPLHKEMRTLRTPTSYHFPKLDLDEEECYVHHAIQDYKAVASKQLKQSRKGFYAFIEEDAYKADVKFNFAIKSAYNREKRRSQDANMYGYQSMQQGMTYCFEINIDDDAGDDLEKKIKEKIEGVKRVGRSRTAQYGLIEISAAKFNRVESNFTSSGETVIYAESRLIFFDEYGFPSFTPSAEDFGVKDGKINWEKSQIRTYAYSPYNFFRSAFDAERKGIEKGSVIVIDGGQFGDKREFAGYYQNEGFGKTIVNPDFFVHENALCKINLLKSESTQDTETNIPVKNLTDSKDQNLFSFLKSQKEQEENEKQIYESVNEFVNKYQNDFKGDTFASQWGAIRSLAMQYPRKKDLGEQLFTNEKEDRDGKKIKDAYLTHGVAKEKWSERNRKIKLQKFFDEIDEKWIQFAMINLSSEMAKKCRRK